jgi:hypothetical protein
MRRLMEDIRSICLGVSVMFCCGLRIEYAKIVNRGVSGNDTQI